jgi:hypothetical protein
LCPVDEVEPEIENVDGSVMVNLMKPLIDCSPLAERSLPCPLVEAWAVAWAVAPRTVPVEETLAVVDPLPLAEPVALHPLLAGAHVPLTVASGGAAEEPAPQPAGAGCGPE